MNAPFRLSPPEATKASSWLPLRFALRELRGGLRGFYVFVACIALGVMAIAGVNAVASGLSEGLAREGRVILGGDLSFSLSLRETSPEERAFIERQGRMSLAATLRAMARTPDGRTALVEVKAVDSAYPLYGAVVLDPAQPLTGTLAERGRARPPTRPCWRGSISKRAIGSLWALPRSSFAPRSSRSRTSSQAGLGLDRAF